MTETFTVRIYENGDQAGTKWCELPVEKGPDGERAFIGRDGIKQCCCNCRYRVRIVGHPWVTGGSIRDRVAWGCEGMRVMMDCEGDFDGAMTLSHEHGMCELWARRKNRRVDDRDES